SPPTLRAGPAPSPDAPGTSPLQPPQRLLRIGRQRVALVGRHLLVALHRHPRFAQLLVGLRQLVPRPCPALGRLAEVVQARHRIVAASLELADSSSRPLPQSA